MTDTQRLEKLEKFIEQSPYEGIMIVPVVTDKERSLLLTGIVEVDYGNSDTLYEGKTLRELLDKLEVKE